MTLKLGFDQNQSQAIADALSKVLANTYALYLKTQNFHWNVVGPNFLTLHELFEGQYLNLATAIDGIAERIRSVGHAAPGSFSEFSQLSTIEDAQQGVIAKDMLKILLEDHQTLIATCQAALEVAESAKDEVTTDLLIGRITDHQKTAWMLDSHLS